MTLYCQEFLALLAFQAIPNLPNFSVALKQIPAKVQMRQPYAVLLYLPQGRIPSRIGAEDLCFVRHKESSWRNFCIKAVVDMA